MRIAWPLLALAALVSGCGSWSGPRAAVEDRPVAGAHRSKAAAAKTAGGSDSRSARTVAGPGKASPLKTTSRKGAEKPQREERRVEAPGGHAIADAVSGDQVLEMKPEKYSSHSPR